MGYTNNPNLALYWRYCSPCMGADRPRTDKRSMDVSMQKEGKMTALYCIALLIAIVSLPYIIVIGGWIADRK